MSRRAPDCVLLSRARRTGSPCATFSRAFDVTKEEVVTAERVTKVKLYTNFDGKEALIDAVIKRESETVIGDDLMRLVRLPRTRLASGRDEMRSKSEGERMPMSIVEIRRREAHGVGVFKALYGGSRAP